jgi:hypothetical protein
MANNSRSIILILFLSLIAFKAFAPAGVSLAIFDTPPIEPFKSLICAIGKVETGHDTLAYNALEEAVGYFQIRPIRVDDYNMRTGSNYTSRDMFDYKISEKVFLYYAAQIGPYDFEQIAKRWNGSGESTIVYWIQVKQHL